ncbi:DUF4188 domain-containing protein [Halomicroarcula limicola]|uniref:DUF4188 domain-containing protein n=1 Tax=Haloarcula limicola TaxID=1429915 RepID=A0A8J7YCL1_9EURY|nr:DUF4188 domain-containing protein [Halomicroarcula limicola]
MVADIDGDFVIYINGMRLNRLRAVHKWLLAGRKIAKMFERLESDPDSGFLGYQPAFMGLRTGAAIQYWRSLEDLRRFARDPEDLHVPAWQWYNDEVDSGGGVGFWAELYVIEDGNYETFFRNVPPIGLGTVADMVPASDQRRRLGLSGTGTPPPEDGDDGRRVS